MHLRVIIVANGAMQAGALSALRAARADLIIAADGGADHCLAAGIIPDRVIGDLDSISDSVLNRLRAEGKQIIAYPADKDFTDLELALKYAVDQGAGEIVAFGALGGRWDMSIANLMLLGADFLKEKKVRMVVENQEAVVLRSGDEITIQGEPGDTLSLIPLGRDAEGITTTGLRFPLYKESLLFAATRGVSNRLISGRASVRLDSGLLLCIHQRI